MLFRYRFSHTTSAGVDYLPLSVELDDWSRSRPVQETVYLKVIIRGDELNSAPVLRVNASQVPAVRQLTSLRLSTELLSVFDRETDPTYIVINVTSRLDPDTEGFFARIYEHTRPLRSFRYDELMRRRIAFRPASSPIIGGELELHIELVAVDSRFAVSSPSRMFLTVLPASSSSNLRVLHNRRLVVLEGVRQQMTLNDLDFVNALGERPASVLLHVKSGLRRGRLEVNGQQRTSVFSLHDVEKGRVIYRHDGSHAGDDRVVLRAVSGRHSLRVRFPIFVLSRDDRGPSLTAAAGQPLTVSRGGWTQITRRNLDTVDRDSPSDRRRTVFRVLDRPAAGEITKKSNPLTSGRRVSVFSQLDVDRGLVFYRHRGGASDRDRIDYQLTDSADYESAAVRGKFSLHVVVIASGNLPPHEMDGTERWIGVDAQCHPVAESEALG